MELRETKIWAHFIVEPEVNNGITPSNYISTSIEPFTHLNEVLAGKGVCIKT